MSEKYPYLNSVIFDSPKLPNGKNDIERNSEISQNLSSSSLVFNIDEHFQDVDLNGCSENSSESPINSDKCIWKLGTDSMELISDANNVTSTAQNTDVFLSSFPNNVFNCSSISSLSSITSNNDLSNPVNSCNKEIAKPNLFDKVDNKTNNRISINNKESKSNIFSQISQLIFNRPHKLNKSISETPLKSTTCLILNDRPLGLPPKSTDEIKRHQDEYNQLISNIKKKERQQNHANRALLKSKIYQEERQYQLTHVWRNFILPNWFHQQTSQYVRHLWWEGIPTSVRDKVWRQCIPNTLKLTKTHYDNFLSQMQERIERYLEPVLQDDLATKATDKPNNEIDLNNRNGSHISPTVESKSSAAYDLYFTETVSIHNKRSSSLSYSANVGSSKQSASSSDVDIRQILLNTIKLDVSRTFPHLNLFQDGGPHHDLLYQLLGAYACYRPDIGYVQGMSFLAAVLILVMNVEDAFICFANILELPCHHAFYALDESEFTVYLESFKLLLFTHLPQLAQHFIQHKLDVNIFLCDWLFTIYSRALPLETALRVWDIFCRDGEATLFRAGLGILRCYEMQLLNSDFEEMAGFLTGQMPESLTASVLVDEMREIKLYSSNFLSTIEEVRTRLLKEKVS